jgi:hypothetical protein
MRIVHIIGLVFTSCLCLFAQNGCIEGRVVDNAGAPISTHVVGVKSDRKAAFDVATGSDGYFHVDSIPLGNYEVGTSDDYQADLPKLPLVNPKPASAVPVAALQEGDCSSITIPRPVRGRLHLILTDLLTSEVVSSPHGSFRYNPNSTWQGADEVEGALLVPPLSGFEMLVSARGYETSQPIKISPLQPGEVRELRVALRPTSTGCITGRIVDQAGKPVTGVEVQASLNDSAGEHLNRESLRVRSGGDGRFSFKALHPGAYDLFTNAIALGYPMGLGDEGFSWVTVQPGSGCAGIAIKLGPKAAKLVLSVLDSVTRKPLEDYAASLNGEKWTMRVVADPMPVPAFKQMQLWVGARGYQPRTVTLSPLQPDEVQTLTIELDPAFP